MDIHAVIDVAQGIVVGIPRGKMNIVIGLDLDKVIEVNKFGVAKISVLEPQDSESGQLKVIWDSPRDSSDGETSPPATGRTS